MTATDEATWVMVCRSADVPIERGVAALVRGAQIAIFRTFDGTLYALSNLDPFSGAYVLSRGIVGTRGDIPTVASPMLKQVFDLRDGRCVDAGNLNSDDVAVPTYPIRERDGFVEVRCRADESE